MCIAEFINIVLKAGATEEVRYMAGASISKDGGGEQPTHVSNLDHIKEWEKLRLKAYMPTKNDKWTIGWGHTSTAKKGMSISQAKAERLLRDDLAWVRQCLASSITVPLTQPQYDALASFVFNVGGSAFSSSTLLRKLNACDYVGAAEQLPRWNKQAGKVLRGLTRRRADEMELFLKGTTYV